MILVIGIGNPLRQDDGAGWMLAERMAYALHALDAAARVLCVQQLAPEHAVDVVAADVTTVCFADVAVDAPGLRLVALDLKAAPAEYTQITHQIGAKQWSGCCSELMKLSNCLDDRTGPIVEVRSLRSDRS